MARTNPLPAGTVNMTVNVPESLDRELRALAEKSGVSRSEYCKTVLEAAARKKLLVMKAKPEVMEPV